MLLEEWHLCTVCDMVLFQLHRPREIFTSHNQALEDVGNTRHGESLSLKLTGVRLHDTGDLQRLSHFSLSQHWPDKQSPRSALLLPKSRRVSPKVCVQGPPTDSHREKENSRIQASC